MPQESTECCPKFHPEKWDGKTFNWNKKPFIKGSIPTFFHIPLPSMIGRKLSGMAKMVEDAGKMDANKEEVLVLFSDPHPFKSDLYISVTGSVPNANNVTLTGTFIAKVFDGEYNAIPKFIKEMDEYLAKQGKKAENYYVHYAYCPKCAEKFGNNYMVLFGKVG